MTQTKDAGGRLEVCGVIHPTLASVLLSTVLSPELCEKASPLRGSEYLFLV